MIYHFVNKPFLKNTVAHCLKQWYLVSFLIWGLFSHQKAHAFENEIIGKAKNGVLDLRNINLNKETVSLNGEWGFYWKNLLSKPDTALSPQYIHFPLRFDQTTYNGQLLPAIGYATYSLTILLPTKRKSLALEIPDTYSCYKLFINNEAVAEAGHPDSIAEKAIPKWFSKTQIINTPSDTLQLFLQVANFWHSKGGPYRSILIGDQEELITARENTTAFDLLLTGCLLMGGLFLIGLYFFGKNDKVLLYFSLFCIFYSYRIVGSGFYVFHSLFPNIPWAITLHLEYLSLYLSALFFALYTLKLYPEDANKKFILFSIGVCIFFSVCTILFPPIIFTQLVTTFILYMCGVMVYIFWVYINALKNDRIGARYALLSTAVLLVLVMMIILQYFRILSPDKGFLFSCYLVFFFLQTLILSFRFAQMLQIASKEAEEGLRAKNEFLSTMSHEIRTPLNSVLGLTHLIMRNKPRPDQVEQLNVLLFSANNLLAIVNDILDYSKIEAGKINFETIEFDIRKLIKDTSSGFQIMAEEKGIPLLLELDPRLNHLVLGDPTRLGQVISNLLNNAVKFTSEGMVKLNTHIHEETETEITVTIRIQDTGIGIDPEKQKLIFEEFTQADTSTSRNFGGTGLGLAICKKILGLQHITLHLSSIPGKGSEFYFTQTFKKSIAKNETSISPDILTPPEDSKPLIGISILLVEDNEINILVARTFLEKWGANIDIALNGKEALDMVNEMKHSLVLMDLHMPVLDGYSATKKMREAGIKIPIVALTASLPKEIENKIKGNGFDEVVVKPFVPEDLYRIVLHFTNVFPSSKY